MNFRYGGWCFVKGTRASSSIPRKFKSNASNMKSVGPLQFFLKHELNSMKTESMFLMNEKKRSIDVEGSIFGLENGYYDEIRDSGKGIDTKTMISRRKASPTRDLMITNWMLNKRRYKYDNRSRLFPRWIEISMRTKEKSECPWDHFDVNDSIFDIMIDFNTAETRDQFANIIPMLRNRHIKALDEAFEKDNNEERWRTFKQNVREVRRTCPDDVDRKSIEITGHRLPEHYYPSDGVVPRCLLDYTPESLFIWVLDIDRLDGFQNLRGVKDLKIVGTKDLGGLSWFSNVENLTLGSRSDDYSPLLKLKKLKKLSPTQKWEKWDTNFDEVKEQLERKGVEVVDP